jgi:hypothetical protein
MKPLSYWEPTVHSFDLPFVQQLLVGWCRVQIYAAGVLSESAPLTVVLSDVPGYEGPSVTNNVELICAWVSLCYLEPLRLGGQPVRWLQCNARPRAPGVEWQEVRFRGKRERFCDPQWLPAEPVRFEWDAALGDTCWAHEVRLVDGRDVPPDELQFHPGQCHRVLTGTCSLEGGQPRVGVDRSDYGYCRDLALLAEVWQLILDYPGRDRSAAELDARALTQDRGLTAHIRASWRARFGSLPEDDGFLPIVIGEALACYGPRPREPISLQGDIPLHVRSGAHRVCIARRLGIPFCAEVSMPRPRARMTSSS